MSEVVVGKLRKSVRNLESAFDFLEKCEPVEALKGDDIKYICERMIPHIDGITRNIHRMAFDLFKALPEQDKAKLLRDCTSVHAD